MVATPLSLRSAGWIDPPRALQALYEQRSIPDAPLHTKYGSSWRSGAATPLAQHAARRWATLLAEF